MTKAVRCTKKLTFCAGHRVMNHEGKCSTPHGHNYTVFVTAEALQLDSLGMVIDFGTLKEKLGGWLDANWDHTFIVYEKDQDLINSLLPFFTRRKLFIAPFNPTAEEMALYLLKTICPKLFQNEPVKITKIVLFETETCSAEAID